jgi:hypothetical protein
VSGGLGDLLGAAEFFVSELDIGSREVEEGPGAVCGFELGEDGVEDGCAAVAVGLALSDGLAEEGEVVAEGADVGGGAGVVAVAGNEGGCGVVGEQGVECFDPGFGGGVDEVGEGVIPEEVAADNDIGFGVVDDGVASGVAGHDAEQEAAVVAEVEGGVVGIGDVGQGKSFDEGALLRGDVGEEELEVFGALPGADVLLGQDEDARAHEDLVSGHVVEVVVGIDDVADGEFGLLLDDFEHFVCGGLAFESVDDSDGVGADEKAGIRAGAGGFGSGVVDGGGDAVSEGREGKRRVGLGGLGCGLGYACGRGCGSGQESEGG